MNRDKLPFPEKLSACTTTSSDTVRVNNLSQQTNLKRQLSTATYRPTGQDIICGRGRGSFLHEGNKVYLSLLRKNVHAYLAASKRAEKGVIISTIVSSLKERGFRFLKQDEKNERWYELSESESYDRTAHAIRDLIRKQKGKNNKQLSKAVPLRSSSPSNSDISVSSSKTDEPSKASANIDVPIPLTSMSKANTLSSSTSNLPSLLPRPEECDMANTTVDADSFDEKISQIPSEVMSPTDRLKAGGFDVFFEFDPDDFGQVLSQLDTEKHERRASLESQNSRHD